MKNLKLALALMLSLSTLCLARLDETQRQCRRRYGPDVPHAGSGSFKLLEGAEEKTYKYHAWKIRVAFLKGESVIQRYRKLGSADGGITLNNDEVKAILVGESYGGTWTEVRPLGSSTPTRWVNAEGGKAKLHGPPWIMLEVEQASAETHRQQLKREKAIRRKDSIPSF